MADSTSLGRALLRSKSINVEANILDEWQSERRLATDHIRLRTVILIGCAAGMLVFVPLVKAFADDEGASARRLQMESKLLDRKLSVLEADGQIARPVIAYDQMVESEQANSRTMLGNLVLIFNATPEKVAISKLKASASGGNLTIELSADSEDSESAKAFAAEAAKGPHVLYSVLASTKKSTLLGPDGLGFDIDKKVGVGK